MKLFLLCLNSLFFIYVSTGLFAQYSTDNYCFIDRESYSLRSTCSPSQSLDYMDVNAVRAALLGAGDMWWDLTKGQYVVPAPVTETDKAVSAIFAGALWIGGLDEGGNVNLSALTYRMGQSSGNFAGPIDHGIGAYIDGSCTDWDQHFTVYGSIIESFIETVQDVVVNQGLSIMPITIPEGILGWPARGNPYFESIHGFSLPDQPLAPFYDHDGDGLYNPSNGDFPILLSDNCGQPGSIYEAKLADQMTFWIYNTVGDHAQEDLSPLHSLKVEVQSMAYAYKAHNAIDTTTFYNQRIYYYGTGELDSVYAGVWADVSLGCSFDDLIGCDIERSLAYVYNRTAVDGYGQCDESDSYGEMAPMLGIKFLKGLSDESEVNDMSSFIYYIRSDLAPNPNLGDPSSKEGYYNYLRGKFRNGIPITFGGIGFEGSGEVVKYAFPDPPNQTNGWSMCQDFQWDSDIRIVMSTGPVNLVPGANVSLDYAVVFASGVQYDPCPNPDPLFQATDLVQSFFDNCLDETYLSTRSNEYGLNSKDNSLILYPNPTSGSFQFDAPGVGTVMIYNVTGSLVYKSAVSYRGEHTIDHFTENSGVYLVAFVCKQGVTYSGKILVSAID